jgi:hypothetical protein
MQALYLAEDNNILYIKNYIKSIPLTLPKISSYEKPGTPVLSLKRVGWPGMFDY